MVLVAFNYVQGPSGCSELPRTATDTLLTETLAAARTRRLGHARALKIILCGALVMGVFDYSHIYYTYLYLSIYIYREIDR